MSCHINQGFCKIKKPCWQEETVLDWEIKIALEDGNKIIPIKLADKKGHMLINGQDLGDEVNTCYLPIFKEK